MFLLLSSYCFSLFFFPFFFNDTPTTEIYTLSLHDALPIFVTAKDLGEEVLPRTSFAAGRELFLSAARALGSRGGKDRKSTRLNSSHVSISYAVFCLKKKKQTSLKSSQA